MSSTISPASGTGGTTGHVEDEKQVVTGASPGAVLAVTRIVMGITFVLGLRRRSL